MMARYRSYLLSIAVVIVWWGSAFFHQMHRPLRPTHVARSPVEVFPQVFPYLSSLEREGLHTALAGDIDLMVRLMADWDLDAQILESYGISTVQRLPRHVFVKGQILGRQLARSTLEERKQLASAFRVRSVTDDLGNFFSLETPFGRFLPQTQLAASFLLALANPEEIVALPSGMREQTHLFPRAVTEKIPSDLSTFHGENLYRAQPDMAFVAHYSRPALLEAFQNQGIAAFTMQTISSIDEMKRALCRVGHVANRPLKAELMALFIEAALLAIDNRLHALEEVLGPEISPPRPLFLHYYTHFSQPTEKTLTGQLLQRLPFGNPIFIQERSGEWLVTVDQEQIVHYAPDCLIVALPEGELFSSCFASHPALENLPCVQKDHVFCVDEATQQSPSQYMVLAYYDLAQALSQTSEALPSLERL